VSLSPGHKLAHYEIVEPIGKGGMGEVFRARDKKLARDVAVKVLPPAFAADPDRLGRFEREAKALAALNHPGIAAIYGVEEDDGTHALVLELVEGEDLSERIARGPLPPEDAVGIARQIAEALDAAHEKGIVHRDLKPANLRLTVDGTVKVLDFGLAKPTEREPAAADLSDSPTMDMGTQAGVILGTAGYMSPEQARGRSVDRRADIWAFGCVLYEMLSARAPFAAETVSDTLARILQTSPDWDALPASVPKQVRALIKRCLEKEPKRRLRDIGDAFPALQVESEEEASGTAVSTSPPRTARTVGYLAAGVLIGAVVVIATRPSPPVPPTRKFVTPVDGLQLGYGAGVWPSPDGERIAYARNDEIFVRHLAELEARNLARRGPDDSNGPLFWSPEGDTVGYASAGRLWKVSLAGGRPVEIASVPESGRALHAVWGGDNRIVFTVWRGGLYSVSSEGGAPELLLAADHETFIDFHRVELLPDGSVIFDPHYTADAGPGSGFLRFDGGELESVHSGQNLFGATYAPSGHLLYNTSDDDWQNATIMAVPVSASTLEMTGTPFRVADQAFGPSVTGDGTLIYVLLERVVEAHQLVWLRPDGRRDEVASEPGENMRDPVLSPDEDRIVVSMGAPAKLDLWVLDRERGSQRRLTFADGLPELRPAWSPDGRRVAFHRPGGDLSASLVSMLADGSGPEETLGVGNNAEYSVDGRYLLFALPELDGDSELVYLELASGGRESAPLRATDEYEGEPSISRDGRLVAFETGEGIFVTQFPSGDGLWQVSAGGAMPRFSPVADRLFYRSDGALVVVEIETEPSVTIGKPVELFTEVEASIVLERGFDIARDGRILAVHVDRVSGAVTDESVFAEASRMKLSIVVVENWLEEFR